jgi:hypothetical protein
MNVVDALDARGPSRAELKAPRLSMSMWSFDIDSIYPNFPVEVPRELYIVLVPIFLRSNTDRTTAHSDESIPMQVRVLFLPVSWNG